MLSEEGLGCHLHGQFVGAFIYADDVTFLTLTNTALNVKLETCSNFVTCHDLQFNTSKTKCIHVSETHKDKHDRICVMNAPLEFKQSTQLLGVHITTDSCNKTITNTVHQFYSKVNSVLYNLKNAMEFFLSTYCLNIYGSQLWNTAVLKEIESYFSFYF